MKKKKTIKGKTFIRIAEYDTDFPIGKPGSPAQNQLEEDMKKSPKMVVFWKTFGYIS